MYGWAVYTERRVSEASNDSDDVIVTLQRAKGSLLFDLGICLVLVSLPTLVLVMPILMALGRKNFFPQFATWYTMVPFAIVPLNNFFPGSTLSGS